MEFTARFEPLEQKYVEAIEKMKDNPTTVFWIGDNRNQVIYQKQRIKKRIKSRRKRKRLYKNLKVETKIWTSEA